MMRNNVILMLFFSFFYNAVYIIYCDVLQEACDALTIVDTITQGKAILVAS